MAIVSLVPLAFVPNGYFIFLPIKFTLVTVLVFGGLALLIARRQPLVLSPSLLAYVGLLAVLILAALFGVGAVTSWIGYPGRGLGVIAWITFGGAFLLGSCARDSRAREELAFVASIASVLVSVYALFQAAGIDPLEWSERVDVSRARSTLGNAAFLGAYLTLVVPLALRLALSPARPARRVIHALAATLGAAALVSTQTRAAWLGLIAAVGLMIVLELPRLRAAPRWVTAATGVAVAAVVVLAAFSPIAPRIRSIFDPTTGTARGRLIQWRLTLDLIKDKPIAGWGPETYAFVFPQYIDSEFERTIGRDVIPDRAHNVFLDIASTAGILGVSAFLAVLMLIARSVARSRSRDAVTIGIAAACAGYLAQLQFSFPVADLDTIFWLFAGILIAPVSRRTFVLQRAWVFVPGICAVLLALWGASDVAADGKLRSALEAEGRGEFDEALTLADRAVSSAPGRAQYLQASARLNRRIGEVRSSPEEFGRGLQMVDRASRIMPRDLELVMDRADLYLSWGQAGGEQLKISSAISQFEKVLASDPFSSRVHLKVGVAYVIAGRNAEAEKAWLTAASLSPESTGPLLNLGRLYEQTGRVNEARDALERVLLIDPSNPTAKDLLARLGSPQ